LADYGKIGNLEVNFGKRSYSARMIAISFGQVIQAALSRDRNWLLLRPFVAQRGYDVDRSGESASCVVLFGPFGDRSDSS
jgi:hypothetical protein